MQYTSYLTVRPAIKHCIMRIVAKYASFCLRPAGEQSQVIHCLRLASGQEVQNSAGADLSCWLTQAWTSWKDWVIKISPANIVGPVIGKYRLAGGRHQVAMTFPLLQFGENLGRCGDNYQWSKILLYSENREIQRNSATNAFIPLNNAREIYQFF